MGREVRMVPENWEHPRKENGRYEPLMGYSFKDQLAEWEEGKKKWKEGLKKLWFPKDGLKWEPKDEDEKKMSWEEWTGDKPIESDYMPEWEESEKTHLQMYETCSEGTPISPVMKTPEELAKWLAGNGASAFGTMTATYEQWLNTIKAGFAPSAVMVDGVLDSGVAHTQTNS